MRTLLLVPALVATSFLLAQPTFTASDEPAIGTTVTVRSTDYRAAGPATNGFVFDVSDVYLGSSGTSQVVAPASTPYASTFPGATYATTSLTTPGSYGYMKVTSTEELVLGQKSASQEAVYTNPMQTAKFPLALGTTWNDQMGGTVTAGGAIMTRLGTSTGSYNGYGTVILPFGTFTNVARIEMVQTYHDTYQGQITTSIAHTVGYRAAGFNTSLFSSSYVLVDFGDFVDTIQSYSIVIDPSMVGIHENPAAIAAVLAPNPATGSTILTLSAPAQDLAIRVLDAAGRVVRTVATEPNSQRITIQVEGLAPGLYHVRATDRTGATGNWPLMVQ